MIPLNPAFFQKSTAADSGFRLSKKSPEVSEGRSPPIVNPKPAACTVVSEPLRSKGFLSPFAARGAVGS